MAAETFDVVDGSRATPGALAAASTPRGRRKGAADRPARTGVIRGRGAGPGTVATRGTERRARAGGEP